MPSAGAPPIESGEPDDAGPRRRSLLFVRLPPAPQPGQGQGKSAGEKAAAARLGPGLRAAGYAVRVVSDLRQAEEELGAQPHDLVLCELPPPIGTAEQLQAIAALARHGPTVLALAASSELYKDRDDRAAALIAAGAYDCLSLPGSAAEVTLALRKAAAREQRLGDRAAARFLPAAAEAAPSSVQAVLAGAGGGAQARGSGFIATAPRMRELLSQLAKVAPHATGVLLTGESGTGKELLARAIHALSPRRDGPFIAVNCGALPETLLESLLFGHVRGAFTDAVRDQPGVFAQASGGTLFLDEVGELPQSLQVKLLRVLQERMVLPLGAQAPSKVDVRLVSATLRDLEADVETGRFRADLYYRLSIVPLAVPPLRERPQDILPLAHHFLRRCAERLRLPVAGITPAGERALAAHDWPGNVRELENTIERAAVLCESTLIDLPDLPLALATGKGEAAELRLHEDDLSIKQVTRRIEIALIRRALIKTRGNRTAAARLLELSHRALLYKLREYNLD